MSDIMSDSFFIIKYLLCHVWSARFGARLEGLHFFSKMPAVVPMAGRCPGDGPFIGSFGKGKQLSHAIVGQSVQIMGEFNSVEREVNFD